MVRHKDTRESCDAAAEDGKEVHCPCGTDCGWVLPEDSSDSGRQGRDTARLLQRDEQVGPRIDCMYWNGHQTRIIGGYRERFGRAEDDSGVEHLLVCDAIIFNPFYSSFQSVHDFFTLTYDLEVMFSIWKYYKTPPFKQLIKSLHVLTE